MMAGRQYKDRKAVAVGGPTSIDRSHAPSVGPKAVAVVGHAPSNRSHAPRVSPKAVAVAGPPSDGSQAPWAYFCVLAFLLLRHFSLVWRVLVMQTE